ncbi:Ig-like domain-containing protein [Bacillus sp. V5-8f]|uniref:Ig-like domain-containing protein n=1 Tax=Bacillus sp. V5-8f TaxID=2053044 RepID=UPI00115A429F
MNVDGVAAAKYNVPANSSFAVKFSGEVDKTTVTTGTVSLTKNDVKQLATVSYDVTKKVATVKLNSGLFEAGKDYVLTER